jgi:hypothetical protein
LQIKRPAQQLRQTPLAVMLRRNPSLHRKALLRKGWKRHSQLKLRRPFGEKAARASKTALAMLLNSSGNSPFASSANTF